MSVTIYIGLVGGSFKFLPNGDAPAKYRVLNFKRVSAKEYNWVAVGTYNEGNLAVIRKQLNNTYLNNLVLFHIR